jgi:hypothetical protein
MVLLALFAAPAAGQEGGLFEVSRFVVCSEVRDKEPVGIASVFRNSRGRVYCFFEAANVLRETHVSFLWFYEGEETARIELPIGEGRRWRTYSSKGLGGRKGLWRVDLQDEEGRLIRAVSFQVQ